MFKDSIAGLEKVFKIDVERPKVVLVTGPPGSMKTSFCYTLMSKYLEKRNEFGLYCTLEETVDSHLKNMESLGVRLTTKMQISDLTDLREIDEIDQAMGKNDEIDYLLFVERMIQKFKKDYGDKFSVFVSHGEHGGHAQEDVLFLQDAAGQQPLLVRDHGEIARRGVAAARQRRLPRGRDHHAGTGQTKRHPDEVPAGREDEGLRAQHGEARSGSRQGRDNRPRAAADQRRLNMRI
jgi:hypothetical protein